LAEEVRPPRVAYLSCSMGTLKRDLAVLAAAGYRPHAIQPYDFFPQTQHVEALALVAHRAG
jgi:tRNA/tmRNA/rRNA uracil-C5-methylase (TrmA/RlmC/RlmD family)